MKHRRILAVIAVCVSLAALSSCSKDFLDEKSYKFDMKGFYNTQEEITMGLNSVYSEASYMMTGCQRTWHSYMINGVGLDTFAETSNNDCFSNWEKLIPNNGYSRHWSDYMYQMINRANIVIDMIEEREIAYTSDEVKNSLLGEALFLRAWAYRALAAFFGSTPIITEHTAEAKYDYVASTRQEVWEFVKSDLEQASRLLPTEPRLEGCVVKATADAYLSEVLLALGEFAEAERTASMVIDKTDGDYGIMTTRFGSRQNQSADRYGKSLAAPAGAYWDLFREGGNQKRANGNKEVLWAVQLNYGTYSTGGGGDSWWRTHFSYIECGWLPGYLQNPTTSQITLKEADVPAEKKSEADAFMAKYGYSYGEAVYKYGVDLACFPVGVEGSKLSVVKEAQKNGRWEAGIARDSIGGKSQGNGASGGQCVLPVRAMHNAVVYSDGSLHGYWDDIENDFRGPANMIQTDYFLPGGIRWSEEKAFLYERQQAGVYTLTAGDTVTWGPRFWKFSDDAHPDGNTTAYDCDWYMMRVAEVYLLRAEARLAQGNTSGAADDINVLRARANASPCTAAEVDIDYILDERARELFGEEQRQVTLNRLSCNPNCGSYVTDKYPVQDALTSNTLYERTRKYGFGYENNAKTIGREWNAAENRYIPNIRPYNFQNPIPIEVIQANTGAVLEQNPGY